MHSNLQTNLPRQEDIVIHGIIYVTSGNTKYWIGQSASEMKRKYMQKKLPNWQGQLS